MEKDHRSSWLVYTVLNAHVPLLPDCDGADINPRGLCCASASQNGTKQKGLSELWLWLKQEHKTPVTRLRVNYMPIARESSHAAGCADGEIPHLLGPPSQCPQVGMRERTKVCVERLTSCWLPQSEAAWVH